MSDEFLNWVDDKLDRRYEGKFLREYLVSRYEDDTVKDEYESFVLNINASWGLGKTFFLERLHEDLKQNKHPVISFNAWQSDFQNDPMIAFISETEIQLKQYFKRSKKAQEYLNVTIKKGAKLLRKGVPIISALLLKQLTGLNWNQIIEILNDDHSELNLESLLEGSGTNDDVNKGNGNKELIKSVISVLSKSGEQALDKYVENKKDIEKFRKCLSDLINYMDSLKSIKLPLFVIIDELDRCRPNYSIELLEKIKHLFKINGVYFILATDTDQLCHSIKAIYGNDFDSARYLNRFFKQTYEFTKPDYFKFSDYLFDKFKILEKISLFSPLDPSLCICGEENKEIFALLSKYFRLTLRDQEQIISHIFTISLTWDKSKTLHSFYLFFLLMLNHVENGDNTKYILFQQYHNKNADLMNKVPDFFNRMDTSVYFMDLPVKNSIPGKFYIQTLLSVYFNYLKYSYKDIFEIRKQSLSHYYKLKIFKKAKENNVFGPDYNTIQDETDIFNLNRYYDIVKKVGQLKRLNEKV